MVVSHAAQKVSWEEQVPQVALKQEAILLADEHLAFAMHWASMQEFWKVPYTLQLCATRLRQLSLPVIDWSACVDALMDLPCCNTILLCVKLSILQSKLVCNLKIAV